MEVLFNQPIVIDNGSGNIRAGYSGDDLPRVNYSNLWGKPKYNKVKYLPSDIKEDERFIGNEAQKQRGILKLEYPIDHGVVQDWNAMEMIWQYSITNGLNIDNLSEHPMLITEEPLNPKINREKMAEVLFESLGVPAINVALPPLLSLYSTGRTTGCVLDSGDGVTTIVPIYNGFSIPGSIHRINIGGCDVTKKLEREIYKDGYNLSKSSEFEIVRNLKERLISVKNIHEDEFKVNEFKLPDGKTIKINESSLLNSSEILFEPSLIGLEDDGVSKQMYDCIINVDIDIRSQLFESLILSGGNTMIKNFGNRTLRDIQKLDNEIKLKMYASKDRKISTFMGGSILASLSTFKNLLVSKSQFQEDPMMIHDKFV